MLFNYILLALSVSIDSLGIGLTYGIKHTKITGISNLILFIISFITTYCSIYVGHYISIIFSPSFSTFLGSSFLIALGFYNIYKYFHNSTTDYDFDHSNYIEKKEAVFLGLALSIDSIFVGISSGVIGFNNIILPILVATFQLIFLHCGNYIANDIIQRIKISNYILTILSSIILIVIGICRIII